MFKVNLQHKEQNNQEDNDEDYQPDKIAKLLKEKEEGIQELEMKT